jgi:hypothetical protein
LWISEFHRTAWLAFLTTILSRYKRHIENIFILWGVSVECYSLKVKLRWDRDLLEAPWNEGSPWNCAIKVTFWFDKKEFHVFTLHLELLDSMFSLNSQASSFLNSFLFHDTILHTDNRSHLIFPHFALKFLKVASLLGTFSVFWNYHKRHFTKCFIITQCRSPFFLALFNSFSGPGPYISGFC